MREKLSSIGLLMDSYRKRQGLTVKEIAVRVGKSDTMLSKVRRGHVNCPIQLACLIADALDAPRSAFIAAAGHEEILDPDQRKYEGVYMIQLLEQILVALSRRPGNDQLGSEA